MCGSGRWVGAIVAVAAIVPMFSCYPGGDPHEGTDRIRGAIEQGWAGVATGHEGFDAVASGDTQEGLSLMTRSVSTLRDVRRVVDAEFTSMRALHPNDCGHRMAGAIDAFGASIESMDANASHAAFDEGTGDLSGYVSGLEDAQEALSEMEGVLPCLEYQHGNDGEWRGAANRT